MKIVKWILTSILILTSYTSLTSAGDKIDEGESDLLAVISEEKNKNKKIEKEIETIDVEIKKVEEKIDEKPKPTEATEAVEAKEPKKPKKPKSKLADVAKEKEQKAKEESEARAKAEEEKKAKEKS